MNGVKTLVVVIDVHQLVHMVKNIHRLAIHGIVQVCLLSLFFFCFVLVSYLNLFRTFFFFFFFFFFSFFYFFFFFFETGPIRASICLHMNKYRPYLYNWLFLADEGANSDYTWCFNTESEATDGIRWWSHLLITSFASPFWVLHCL